MKNYNDLGVKLLYGYDSVPENTRVGKAYALHGEALSFDLTEGFPLMTTKFVGHKSIIHETLWYLKGTTSIDYLQKNGVHVWDKFANEHNEIGKTYSYQFRNFNGIDQVKEVIKQLKDTEFTDRRAIINLYNPNDLKEMSIPPCIAMIQFFAYNHKQTGERLLDAIVYQRSADFCLGVPYDIAEMALLAHIIGAYVDATPKLLSIHYGNVHVYEPHVETLKLQLEEIPMKLPTLVVDKARLKASEPEDLTIDMFEIKNIPKGRKKFSYELF